MPTPPQPEIEGIILVDKPVGKTSFSLVGALRRRLGVRKIGHAGTLDPFATGLMVMLVGKKYTRMSDQFLCSDKEYVARLHLGVTTDTFDCEGQTTAQSEIQPSLSELQAALACFQGDLLQVPPMFSAKKINGQKLYDLARKGKVVERQPVKVNVALQLLSYAYPFVDIQVACSKGTYIRSLAYDIGLKLGCGAHVAELKRTRSGDFHLADSVNGALLQAPEVDIAQFLIKR